MARALSHEIVIVGGNFAGLSAALELPAACDVAVVDPHPWFEWRPNIHELVSGVKKPRDLRLPRRRIVEEAGHRFLRDRVRGFDFARRSLQLGGGRRLDYETCVLALGGVSNDFGVAGAAANAMSFKTVDDCAAIGRRLRTLAGEKRALSIVVVGGGFEGIEALGEVLRAYRRRPDLEIHIVEMAPRLMADGPKAIDAMVRRRIADLPVRIHCSETVARVTARRVYLESGRRLPSDLTIWTAGARAAPSLDGAAVPRSRDGWIKVGRDLACRDLDGVFVAGDLADPPRRFAKQAYHAIDMGRHAARNILRRRRGEDTLPFAPSDKPMLLAFGDLDTFLISGSRVVASPLLAAAKEGVFQATIAGFDILRSRAGRQRAGGRGLRALKNLVLPKFGSARDLVGLLSLRVGGTRG